jgi:hypothetical protein
MDRRQFFELLFAAIAALFTPVEGKRKAVGSTVKIAIRPGIQAVIPEIIAISAPSEEVEMIDVTTLEDHMNDRHSFIMGYSELVIDAYYTRNMAGTIDALNRGQRPLAHIELPGVGAWKVRLVSHAGIEQASLDAPYTVRLFAEPEDNGFIQKGRRVV